MNIKEVYKRYLESEESEIEVNSWEIDIESFRDIRIPEGTLIILVGKDGRKRQADLGILTYLFNKCKDYEFVRDFLNMELSLEDIYKKYKVLNEVERLAYCRDLNDLDEDVKAVVNNIKDKVLLRVKE
ncbi:MAG: hypothetical protein OWQ54_01150 [Sulfolobaceae archaeon]|nr:hypothetical protein [Sulfolobaceae archaeon]